MSPFLISQLLAGASFFLDVSAFHFSRQKTLCMLALSTTLLSVHFLLLNQTTSCCLMLLAACRYITALFTQRRALCGLLILTAVACAALTWSGLRDLLPLTGSVLLTYAAFQTRPTRLRRYTVIGSGFWVVNNILAHSPVATLMELAFLFSTLVSYFRHRRSLAT